jgi:TPR repeat protein
MRTGLRFALAALFAVMLTGREGIVAAQVPVDQTVSPPASGSSQADKSPADSASSAVRECDRLAAHPDDPGRMMAGVPWEKLDGQRAVAACSVATDRRPKSARLQFEFGRSLNKIAQYQDAMSWYRKAAEQGYAAAQTNLGLMYSNGQGAARNPEMARQWIAQAAAQSYPPALNAMGVIYMSGIGVGKDDGQALAWFLRASTTGYAPAKKNLGLLYELGRGVDRDLYEAARLYGEAAQHGHEEAQGRLAHVAFRIGLELERGLPGPTPAAPPGSGAVKAAPPDYAPAAHWYQRAADAGSADAQFSMGCLYERGLGVPKDLVRAYAAYLVAERDGRDEIREAATVRRRKLLSEMWPVQVFSALDLFDQWEERSRSN